MNCTAYRVDLTKNPPEVRKEFVYWGNGWIFHWGGTQQKEFVKGKHIWFDNPHDAARYVDDWVSNGEKL